ncbi:hypothetical protein NA56DRAFT_640801 [Hyaloscypha hepaticicola]|uniref:C2H2-type domain-containing protein n=1 Tax=Hyaloscypha hepaticicola TaxID=2082293 RepID=A0A2J6QL63_9HELO|nr:hypothetical protein NA56DRAFT_640801 [Hyaloscypha hepaticicola]
MAGTIHRVLRPLQAITLRLLRTLFLEDQLYPTLPLHLRLDFTATPSALPSEKNAEYLMPRSQSGYYYNALTGQRQPLANVSTANCHDSVFNNDTEFACTIPNQTQVQGPQTLLTGFNIYSNPDTGFEESASVGPASQPYEHIPGPSVNGGHPSGSYNLFGAWSPASQSMQAPPAIATQAPVQIQCTALGCSATFKREPDRLRHEAAVHGINQLLQLYLCPVIDCSKSQGSGYTRKDKLTEHLWKKHGNLGYAKRV